MKILYYLFSLLLLTVIISCQASKNTVTEITEQPNIVLIITDDQGWGDLGFHGNPDIKTPVLDSFAKQSIRFTNFYVSPVCAPTRSSLMTGRYSLRTGVYDTYNGGAMMAGEEVTLAELLQQNGYRTGMFGKWHLGDNYPSRPQEQGFDYSLMHRSGGMAQVGDVTTYFRFDSAYFDPVLLENGKNVQRNGYCSDIFTDGAVEFIEANQNNPFFVYLAFNAPHTPLQLPQEYEQMYANLEIDSTRYPRFARSFPKMNENNTQDTRSVYGMVSNIDDNVGKLLQKLNELKLTKNTLVIFMTDNGPQQVRYTGGFRDRKGSVYEGGIRVPFFIRYPKQFPINVERDIPAAHIDVVPTVLELCKIPKPENLDGQSLLPVIAGEEVDWANRPLFFYWQRGFEEPYQNIAVRKGDYKLVGHTGHQAEIEAFELFNLQSDPSELHNLVAQQSGKAVELKNDFDVWYKDVMQSPHLGTVRAVIGHEAENPSLLNRNDAKGNWGIWAEDAAYVYWDVTVAEAGVYDITCHFKDTIESSGNLIIRVGNTQRTLPNEMKTQSLTLHQIPLSTGEFMLEAGYLERENQRRKLLPFYIEVERK